MSENLKPLAVTPREQTEEEKQAEIVLKRILAYVQTFELTEAGRDVLADLRASLDGATYRPGMDTHESTWLAGRRSVYLDLLTSIEQGRQALAAKEDEAPTNIGVMPDSIEDL